jgi:hypothetical protein
VICSSNTFTPTENCSLQFRLIHLHTLLEHTRAGQVATTRSTLQKKVKVKVTLEQAMKDQKGISYSSTLSLTSLLDGVGGQRHTPAALPREKPGTHCIGVSNLFAFMQSFNFVRLFTSSVYLFTTQVISTT